MNTYLEISRPAFSSFLKAEVAEFANKTIEIVGKANPNELLIAPVFEPLLELKPEIDLLTIRYGTDPHRAKIELSKSKLMLTISTMKLKVRLISKSGVDEGLHVIKIAIDTYLRYLSAPRKNDKVVAQQVKGFLNEMATNVSFSEAIDKHNLTDLIIEIEEALDQYREAINTRLAFRAQRPAIHTSQIVAKVRDAVYTLFKGIEVAQLVNSELDYEPLADKLNELVSNYKLSGRLRTAYNKRKAEEKKGNNPVEDEPLFDEEGNLIEGDNWAGEGDEDTELMPTSYSANGFRSYRFAEPSLTDDELLEEDANDDEELNTLEDELSDDLEE